MTAWPPFRLHLGDGVVFADEGTVVVVDPGWCSVRELHEVLAAAEEFDEDAARELTARGATGVGWALRQDDGSVELRRLGAVRLSVEEADGLAASDDAGPSVTRGSWLLAVGGSCGPPVEGTWLRAGLVLAGGVSSTAPPATPDTPPPPAEQPAPGPPPVGWIATPPAPAAAPPSAAPPAAPPATAPPVPAAPAATPPAQPAAPPPRPPDAPVPHSHPHSPAPAPTRAPQGPPPPRTPGTFIDLGAGVAAREPLPRLVVDDRAVQVRGVHCRNGHFNNPHGRLCYLCGDNMQNQSIAIGADGEIGVLGKRPPLGILTLDDGSIYQLSDDLVLGRDPVTEGNLAAVVSDTSVSRNHLRIHLHDWEVLVEDLGSSNGSHLLPAGASVYQPLVPGTAVPLRSGAVLAFGQRWATFESTAAAG